MNLSESEKKYLVRVEKNMKRINLIYTIIALISAAALSLVAFAFISGRMDLIVPAVIVIYLVICYWSIVNVYKRMFVIISKLKVTIKELESGK
jgi:hypothetical protein